MFIGTHCILNVGNSFNICLTWIVQGSVYIHHHWGKYFLKHWILFLIKKVEEIPSWSELYPVLRWLQSCIYKSNQLIGRWRDLKNKSRHWILNFIQFFYCCVWDQHGFRSIQDTGNEWCSTPTVCGQINITTRI